MKDKLQTEFLMAGTNFITEVIQPLRQDIEVMKKNNVRQEKINERIQQVNVATEFYRKCQDIVADYHHIIRLQHMNNLLIEDYANYAEQQAINEHS